MCTAAWSSPQQCLQTPNPATMTRANPGNNSPNHAVMCSVENLDLLHWLPKSWYVITLHFITFFPSWVELGGETNVCKCCALKCKGPPSFGGPANGPYPICQLGYFQ